MHEQDWNEVAFPNVGALSYEELKGLIRRLEERERRLSYERRIHHGMIDLLRAELVARLRRWFGPDSRRGADPEID